MVNHLMRARQAADRKSATGGTADGKAKVRSKATVTEVIGSVTLEPGEVGWIGCSAAMALESQGTVEILEYEQEAIDGEGAANGESPVGDRQVLPGFICEQCFALGKITRFAKKQQLIGHLGTHNPRHGKHGPPKQGKPKTKKRSKKRRISCKANPTTGKKRERNDGMV